MPEIGQKHGNMSEKIFGYDTEQTCSYGTILSSGSFPSIDQWYDWSLRMSVSAERHRNLLLIDEGTKGKSEAKHSLTRVSELVLQFHLELGKPISSQVRLAYFVSCKWLKN